jgi:acetamidase/formamidase
MTLVVHIETVEPGDWGWNAGQDWRDDKAKTEYFYWDIDKTTNTARNQLGQVVPLKPFMGVMGMPADVDGWQSTAPPRFCGGNMDCKELVAGSTLYLPIAVDGALFSTGDGHAVQADGEASGTAIECPMERVDLRFDLRSNLDIKTPFAETPSGWIALGFDEDLDKAYDIALWAMIEMMTERYSISVGNALSLASLVVEMRVTQRVNGTSGVHALLPLDAFRP